MKYIKQFGILLLISFLGEVLHWLIPVSVPASIYGILILFGCLELGVVRKEDVKDAGMFLIEIMPLMFIPAAVGLMDSWNIIQPSWFSYILITAVSTIVIMVVSGVVTQKFIRPKKQKEEPKHE